MNLVERLLAEIKRKRKRIVICGDTMTDRWVHGRTAQCQDHCTKFVQETTVDVPGGAANAERSLSKWGVDVELCGHWKEHLGVKTRFVDQDSKIVFRHDRDEWAGGKEYGQARANSLEWVGCADGVLLSDYDKGYLTPEFIHNVADLCRKRGVPCVADCKRAPKVYAGCVLKCNEDWNKTNIKWWNKTSGPWVLTLGYRGPCFNNSGRYDEQDFIDISHLSAVECVNHVGAGDCFAAHLILALAYSFSLKEAAALAHSAGRVYVQHIHNRPPLPIEIAADMSQREVTSTSTP